MDRNEYKIVLIGNSGVGKTSLVYWFMNGRNMMDSCPTVGAGFTSKTFDINGKKIKFNIWDTAGQERFRSVVKMYYKKTKGCICVFDITDRNTFNALHNWIDDYQQNNDVVDNKIILVANKCDNNRAKWMVSEKEIDKYAQSIGCECMYTNCITGNNVVETFYRLAELIINADHNTNSENENNKTINLHTDIPALQINKCKC